MLLAAVQLRSWARAALAATLLLCAGAAEAQQLLVTVPPTLGTPPVANAVTRGRPGSLTLNANNVRAGNTLRQFQVRFPNGYTVTGGQGPAGWTVTAINWFGRQITFRVADCAVGGIPTGATESFRIDLSSTPGGAIASDVTDDLDTITGSDPCPGGSANWSETTPSSVDWQRKALLVTGSVSPGQGAPPLPATATYTVTNLSNGTRTVTPSSAVSPGTGWTGGTCSPASANIASNASADFTCSYTLAAAGAYAFAGSATGTNGTSAVGAVVGTVEVGAATATFAFDTRIAGVGDQVRATLAVRNEGVTTIAATPPTYAQLTLQNLARASGTADPVAADIPAGGSADFVYLLDVTGVVGATYVAQGTATTTAGNTNLAVTPAGTVSASRVEWTPPAIVKSRTASPYNFTVTVTNGSASSVTRVDIVNPQDTTWTGIAPVSTSGPLTFNSTVDGGGTTTYLRYNGTLTSGATATLNFRFTAVPTVTQTTGYPFTVRVYQGNTFNTLYSVTASVAVPIPDVGALSILSSAGGQVLSWVNTARADAPHDGVVVFRTAAPGVPTVPADFVDYGLPANQGADFFFEAGEGSTVDTIADPAVGAYNYRVCNRDALFVYSDCRSGFWNGAGWLDSTPAPAGGWTHQVGGAIHTMPGIVPGSRAGVAASGSIAVVDAATGDRSFDPVALEGPLGPWSPWSNAPILPVSGGGNVLFAAADDGTGDGTLTAVDVATGATLWQVTKPGESFVAGVSAILRQYANPVFQAAYPNDLLLLPSSTTGHVLAVDATTGATLWTIDTGAEVQAGTWHDATTNRLFVATNGGGVLAYDLATSNPTTAPSLASGFVNPGGTFAVGCVRAPAATDFACIDVAGNLVVLDKVTGAVRATVATGAAGPSGLVRTTGTLAGFVVSSDSRVVRVLWTEAPPAAPELGVAGQWPPTPGLALSRANVLQLEGLILVVASDRQVHRLLLGDASEPATPGPIPIPPQQSAVVVSDPVLDVLNDLLLFGSDDGRLWAVPF